MILDPHYPPPPMGLPTSATRGNWHPAAPAPPPWGPGPEGHAHPMAPPPGMYMQSYYPAGYYRPPGMPMPPHLSQINPELLAQSSSSNGETNGIGPPESALRNTSAGTPKPEQDGEQSQSGSDSASNSNPNSVSEPGPSSMGERGAEADTREAASQDQNGTTGSEGADASTLMAAAALQAVLAYQKEQEMRDAEAAARTSTQPDVPAQPPPVQDAHPNSSSTPGHRSQTDVGSNSTVTHVSQIQATQEAQPPDGDDPDLDADADADADAIGEPDHEMSVEDVSGPSAAAQARPQSVPPLPPALEQLVAEDGTPMLNPGECSSTTHARSELH